MSDKVGFFYSLFCNDDISKSMRYLVPFVKNVKLYNSNKLFEKDMHIILHTDEFSFDVIKCMAKQENVSLDKIIVKTHRRNIDLRGMIWRFESFYTNEYDICINAEGDWAIERYFGQIEYLKKSKYAYILHDTRQFAINKNCFAAGIAVMRSSCLSEAEKEKVKCCVELIENIEHVHYGVDEAFFVKVCKKFFKDKYGLIVVHDDMRIFQHVENFEKEKKDLKQLFDKQDIMRVGAIHYPPVKFTPQGLKFATNTGYILENKKVEFTNPLRVPENEWCNTALPQIIDKILDS